MVVIDQRRRSSRHARSRPHRPGPASSNTSTSPARLRGERPLGLRRAQAHGPAPGRRRAGVDADVIVPVPDFGVPAALGYAQEAGLPFEMGIIRNHYVGRTFIQPTQGARELGVRMKHSPNRAVLAGKRVMLIDDSIVRGTTSVQRRADGARRRRQGSPPALGLAADHVAGLLRHRHARPRPAAGRQPIRSRRCAKHPRGRQPGLPLGRRPLLGDGRGRRATRSTPSSPTTTSPATTPPACSTARSPRAATRWPSASSPSWSTRDRTRSAPSARMTWLSRLRPDPYIVADPRPWSCWRACAPVRGVVADDFGLFTKLVIAPAVLPARRQAVARGGDARA